MEPRVVELVAGIDQRAVVLRAGQPFAHDRVDGLSACRHAAQPRASSIDEWPPVQLLGDRPGVSPVPALLIAIPGPGGTGFRQTFGREGGAQRTERRRVRDLVDDADEVWS